MLSLIEDAVVYGEPVPLWTGCGSQNDIATEEIVGEGSTLVSHRDVWTLRKQEETDNPQPLKKSKREDIAPGDEATIPEDNSVVSKDQDCWIHGLAGYFTADLYGSIVIDTRPAQRTCFHWETMFFPLKAPFKVISGSKVPFMVRRRTSGGGCLLWYEWAAGDGLLPVHNRGGVVHAVSLPCAPPV